MSPYDDAIRQWQLAIQAQFESDDRAFAYLFHGFMPKRRKRRSKFHPVGWGALIAIRASAKAETSALLDSMGIRH